jgi:hypothetical protein
MCVRCSLSLQHTCINSIQLYIVLLYVRIVIEADTHSRRVTWFLPTWNHNIYIDVVFVAFIWSCYLNIMNFSQSQMSCSYWLSCNLGLKCANGFWLSVFCFAFWCWGLKQHQTHAN